MISVIIPTYRNPEYLNICLKSAIEQQKHQNEIIVAVDGFIEESQEILNKYKDNIQVLDLGQNQGMQQALNLGVMNATNEIIFIANDDNVFCKNYDLTILQNIDKHHHRKTVLTLNQIEPTGPGIFNFPVNNLGRNHFLEPTNLIYIILAAQQPKTEKKAPNLNYQKVRQLRCLHTNGV